MGTQRAQVLDPTISNPVGIMIYLTSLLQHEGEAVGLYDGRVTSKDIGIAGSLDPNSGANDPTLTAVGSVYTTMWNVYLNEELKYTSTCPFMDMSMIRNRHDVPEVNPKRNILQP